MFQAKLNQPYKTKFYVSVSIFLVKYSKTSSVVSYVDNLYNGLKWWKDITMMLLDENFKFNVSQANAYLMVQEFLPWDTLLGFEVWFLHNWSWSKQMQ